MNKWLLLTGLLLPLSVQQAGAQKIFIEGDTIRMAPNTRTTLVFPDDIRSVKFSSQEDYSPSMMGASVTIQPNGKPRQIGSLTIIEGPKAETKGKSNRMHTFVMVFSEDQKLRPSDLFHNYSSTKLIAARMKALDAQRTAVTAAPPETPVTAAVLPDKPAGRSLSDRPAGMEEKPGADVLRVDGMVISNEAIRKKALQNTNKFSECLQYLCQRHTPEDYQEGISSGLSYFINDTVWVETSSVNSTAKNKRRIRRYLAGLTQSSYDKVDISWGDLQYVSNLVLNPDGRYHGQVQFTQTFKGYRDGDLVYGDRTEKNAEVILVVYKNLVNGEEQMKWNVLLGNIGVNETAKLD